MVAARRITSGNRVNSALVALMRWRNASKAAHGKVSGKRGRGRPQLSFENTTAVTRILEEGHVKSMRIPQRARMKRLMTVDEAKEIDRDRCS